MKAGIFCTGTGPILILTTYSSFTDSKFIEKLSAKGLKKFIVYEVPNDLVKQRYGMHFNVIMGDLHQTDDLRVAEGDRVTFDIKNGNKGPVAANVRKV